MRTMLVLAGALLLAGCGGANTPPNETPRDTQPAANNAPVQDEDGPPEAIPDGDKTPAAPEVRDEDGKLQTPGEPEVLKALPGEEAQINKVYRNGETIKASVYGVAFTLPSGLGTAIQQGADGFVLESTEKQSLGAILMKRQVTLDEVKAVLAEPHDLGDGIVLRLQGSVQAEGNTVRARYGNGTYGGMAIATIGEHGNGVAYMLAAAETDRAYVEKKLEEIAASTKLLAPQESKDEQAWKQLLSGHKLTYLKSHYSGGSGGSYTGGSTNEEISLRADGTFYYYFKDSFSIDAGAQGGGAGGYGRSADEDQGRWSIELVGTNVQLVLAGEKRERRYKLAYSDKKTYLNGTRYFRIPLS